MHLAIATPVTLFLILLFGEGLCMGCKGTFIRFGFGAFADGGRKTLPLNIVMKGSQGPTEDVVLADSIERLFLV